MDKDNSRPRSSTPRNSKPYDVSNSFVKRIASRVSGIFGGIFTPPESVYETDSNRSNDAATPVSSQPSTSSNQDREAREHLLSLRLLPERTSSIGVNLEKLEDSKSNDVSIPSTSNANIDYRELYRISGGPQTRSQTAAGSSTNELRPSYDFPSRLAAESDDRTRIERSRYDNSVAGTSRISEDRQIYNVADRLTGGPSGHEVAADEDRLASEPSRGYDAKPRFELRHSFSSTQTRTIETRTLNEAGSRFLVVGRDPYAPGPSRGVDDRPRYEVDELYAGPSRVGDDRPQYTERGSKMARLDIKTSGDDGDRASESSETSGCSSLVPQADKFTHTPFLPSSRRKALALDEKLSYARQLKHSRASGSGLFLNRSIPVEVEQTRSSRVPGFDISVCGKPILNKSVRETMMTSPFYTGHTTYGGASARRGSLGPSRATTPRIPVKPAANASETNVNMSQTARRILAALEEFSTPLSDAKRIPTPAPLMSKRRAVEVPTPVSKRPALAVPTVADILKMKRLEQLQDSTELARKVAVRSDPVRAPSPPKKIGKIVTKKKDRDKPLNESPPPPPVLLPDVPLPIETLPKFDLPPPVKPSSTTVLPSTPTSSNSLLPKTTSSSANITLPRTTISSTNLPKTTSSATTSDVSSKYTFASPTVITTNCSAFNDKVFTFSSPAPMESCVSESKLVSVPKRSDVPITAPELKTGSVMDVLGKKPIENSVTSTGFGDKFKPAAGSWSCESCMVNNISSATVCVSCTAPKSSGSKENDKNSGSWSFGKSVDSSSLPRSEPKLTTTGDADKTWNFGKTSDSESKTMGFGDKFKPSSGSWTCDVCMITNGETATKCAACETQKPGKKESGFGDKFKPAAGSWTCDVCMVTNGETATKCGACETPKPGKKESGFGDKFKPATGSWTCDACMVSNGASVTKCVACETVKPGSAKETGFGDKFKPAAGSWTCDSCMLGNTSSATKCAACETQKPGVSNGPKSLDEPWKCSVCLIKNNESAMKCAACDTSRPNEPISVSKTSFDFGLPPGGSMFKFGIDKAGPEAKTIPNGFESKPAFMPKPSGFTFGIPATSEPEKPVASVEPTPLPVITSTFSFGAPAAPVEKVPDPPAPANGPVFTTPTTGFFGSLVNKSLEPPQPSGVAPQVPAAAPAPFVFGSSNPSPFAFGSQAAEEKKAPAFTFSASSATPAFGGFTDPAKPAAATSQGIFHFKASPAVAQPQPAPPMFGASTAPAFGGNTSSFQPLSGGFSFGSNVTPATAAPAPNTAFQFGAPATPAATPATSTSFNLAVPTTFNFSGGQTPTFSAPPQSAPGPDQKRRIIRAIRRTNR